MARIPLASWQDPRLAPYRELRSRGWLARTGRFIAEGRLLVERVLASHFPVESVLVVDHGRETLAVPDEIPVYTLPAQEVARLVGFDFHRGVLACGLRRPAVGWEQWLAAGDTIRTVVICASVGNPTNLGNLLRNCAAFGVDLVVLGDHCADPLSRRVLRVSMGAALKSNVGVSRDLERDLIELRARLGLELVAAVADARQPTLASAARPPCLGLVFGNEATGIPPAVEQLCPRRLTVPMAAGTDSLNVAVASAVFLYHFQQLKSAATPGIAPDDRNHARLTLSSEPEGRDKE